MLDLLARLEQRAGHRAADGLQVLSADLVVRRPVDPAIGLLILPATPRPATEGFDPAVLPGRDAHGDSVADLLRRMYPADHRVVRIDSDSETTVGEIVDTELVAQVAFLPPLAAVDDLTSPHALPWLVARLRAPDGCPWDREQDHQTLRRFLLEETYEAYDVLEHGSTPQLAEELGDVLLQVVLHAQYAAEAGVFDLADVQRSIMSKIVRRHPHVFGDVHAETAKQVIANWEAIKATERAERELDDAGAAAPDADMPAAFAGLSRTLPALAYANEMQDRAAGLGYDWPDVEGVIDKIEEEAVELLNATDAPSRHEEFGDLLFVVVNLGRKLGIDPEASLRSASRKFAARFARVERFAEDDGVELRALGLDELDALWQRAKAAEQTAAEVVR